MNQTDLWWFASSVLVKKVRGTELGVDPHSIRLSFCSISVVISIVCHGGGVTFSELTKPPAAAALSAWQVFKGDFRPDEERRRVET